MPSLSQWRQALRATPNYIDRLACGQMGGVALLSATEQAAVQSRRAEIDRLRAVRRARQKSPPGETRWQRERRLYSRWRLMSRFGRANLYRSGSSSQRIWLVGGDPTQHGNGKVSPRAAMRAYLSRRRLSRHAVAYGSSRRRWRVEISVAYDGVGASGLPMLPRGSRRELARAIRAIRAARPLQMATLPDGGLGGIRLLRITPEGSLMSPQRQRVWEGPSKRSTTWTDDGACRGEAGVHAIWLTRGDIAACLDVVAARIAKYDGCLPPAEHRAYAIVGGYGRYVAGEDGWRAEQQILQRLYVPADHAAAIIARYPDVPVQVTA